MSKLKSWDKSDLRNKLDTRKKFEIRSQTGVNILREVKILRYKVGILRYQNIEKSLF